jgi:hypothetical protein
MRLQQGLPSLGNANDLDYPTQFWGFGATKTISEIIQPK